MCITFCKINNLRRTLSLIFEILNLFLFFYFFLYFHLKFLFIFSMIFFLVVPKLLQVLLLSVTFKLLHTHWIDLVVVVVVSHIWYINALHCILSFSTAVKGATSRYLDLRTYINNYKISLFQLNTFSLLLDFSH